MLVTCSGDFTYALSAAFQGDAGYCKAGTPYDRLAPRLQLFPHPKYCHTRRGVFVGAVPQPSSGGYVEVRDTTLSTNTASGGQGGGLYNDGEVDLGNVTIKDNTNGIFNFGNGEVTRIHNTVLQNSGSLNCDGDGTLPTSAGGNFSTDNSCGLTAPSDRQGTGLDPLLGPLANDSASFTSYHLPQAGSPLINAAVSPCSPTDQRYALRPDACDIGAVEYGGLLPRDYVPMIIR